MLTLVSVRILLTFAFSLGGVVFIHRAHLLIPATMISRSKCYVGMSQSVKSDAWRPGSGNFIAKASREIIRIEDLCRPM